jgi:hypothetical protein
MELVAADGATPARLAWAHDLDELDLAPLYVDGEREAAIAEVVALRAEAAAAVAEAERLRERIHELESWLEAATRQRRVEYVQAQRLAMMKAVERDQRVAFVLSLPLVLLVLYCLGLAALAVLLLEGHV